MAMSHYRVAPEASVKGARRLVKADSSNAAFGDVFATKNKPASKKFLPFCLVTVHDFGPESYEINGQSALFMSDNRSSKEYRFSDPESMLAEFSFLQGDKPEWAFVRWIDVEGFTPKIVQFLLRLVDCERQYTFNNIVDTKQRAMGLLLDGIDEDVSKFLLVTKAMNLDQASSRLMEDESAQLYDVDIENMVEIEQISYLLKNDPPPSAPSASAPASPGTNPAGGILISFQEGKDGDVFGGVRERLFANGKERRRGAAYLMMQLVRASCESAGEIEHYVESALDQLKVALRQRPGSLDLANKARQMEAVCDDMRRIVLPFAETLEWMTGERFPKELLGNTLLAWEDLHMQQHRLANNIQGSQTMARGLVESYRDTQAKKAERTSTAISLVLAIFSPMSFITGLYGMNFNGETSSMPELNWTAENNNGVNGYQYFWILLVSVVSAIIIVYMNLGLIPSPLTLYRWLTR